MSQVQSAINKGQIPHSVIEVVTRYCQEEDLQGTTVFDLYEHIQNAEPVKLFERYNLSDALQVNAMLDALNELGNLIDSEVLSRDTMEYTGWQVEVDMYKPSGKFAYSGIVSLGQAKAFDNLLPVIVSRQNFVASLDATHYSVVVSDTRTNETDLNYTRCAKRLFVAGKNDG